jgi:hypothetical protein
MVAGDWRQEIKYDDCLWIAHHFGPQNALVEQMIWVEVIRDELWKRCNFDIELVSRGIPGK